MKVVSVSGLAVETATATKRTYLARPTKDDRLTLRDAAIAQLRRHGWTRPELEAAFRLTGRQVNRILADIKAVRIAALAYEEDAA